MSRRNTTPVTFKAAGLSDSVDGTNAFPGAMFSLSNLIPSPGDKNIYVPRPASTALNFFSLFPAQWGSFIWGQAFWGGFGNVPAAKKINALLVVGNIAYGMVSSVTRALASPFNFQFNQQFGGTFGPQPNPFNGKDVPFAFDLSQNTFQAINIPAGAASLPNSPAETGDWTPPTMQSAGSRIIITHPGYPGGATKFGWLDISGFSDSAKTGNTHSSTLIDGLSSNVLQAGWQVGMTITGNGIPANTTIVSIASPGGLSLVLSQAATATASGVSLTTAGGTFTAPLYGSGDCNGNNFVGVPTCSFIFNGRAYYGVPQNTSGLSVQFSDALNPCQITNATQALSFANGLVVTAMIGLPVTQTQGAVLQALLCFQSDANIVQITGDQATNNLAANNVGTGTGTIAPLSLAQTPYGIACISGDGVRLVDLLARVSEPIGQYGQGVRVPFVNALNPTRIASAYNDDVLRISLQNGAKPNLPFEEYWYHFGDKSWSGPHTLPADVIQGFNGSNRGFILAAHGVDAVLWSSQVIPSTSTIYVENNQAMTFSWQNTLQPDNQEMVENAVVESTLALALPNTGIGLAVSALNESGVQLDMVQFASPAPSGPIWGSFVWGQAQWATAQSFLAQYDLPWHRPLVFKQMSLKIIGFSAPSLKIGNFYFRYRSLGYRMQAIGPMTELTSGGQIPVGNIPVSGGQR